MGKHRLTIKNLAGNKDQMKAVFWSKSGQLIDAAKRENNGVIATTDKQMAIGNLFDD